MSVKEDDYVKKTFYSIYGGKVVRQWFQDDKPEGLSNLTKRVTPESKRTVWYKPYIFGGIITNVTEKKNDALDGVFEIHLEVDGTDVLVFKSQSGYHKSFLLRMQNFPPNEELTFSPYNFKDREEDKRIIGMVIKDEAGESIPAFYTKEDPKDLPQPTQNRKKEWNWTKVEEFLDDRFDEWYESYFAETTEEVVEGDEESPNIKDKEGDDLPF